MAEQSEAVRVIAREIEGYLGHHPRAADTVEGIRMWWLADRDTSSMTDVLRALESLVDRGVVQRRTLPNDTTVYSGVTAPGHADERAGGA